jgi:hypothetical protein
MECSTEMSILSLLSAIFAIAAAALWFLSAVIKTPEHFAIHVVNLGGSKPIGPIGGGYVDQAQSSDLIDLANALRKQSRLSAWAASCAGVSALLQAALLFL